MTLNLVIFQRLRVDKVRVYQLPSINIFSDQLHAHAGNRYNVTDFQFLNMPNVGKLDLAIILKIFGLVKNFYEDKSTEPSKEGIFQYFRDKINDLKSRLGNYNQDRKLHNLISISDLKSLFELANPSDSETIDTPEISLSYFLSDSNPPGGNLKTFLNIDSDQDNNSKDSDIPSQHQDLGGQVPEKILNHFKEELAYKTCPYFYLHGQNKFAILVVKLHKSQSTYIALLAVLSENKEEDNQKKFEFVASIPPELIVEYDGQYYSYNINQLLIKDSDRKIKISDIDAAKAYSDAKKMEYEFVSCMKNIHDNSCSKIIEFVIPYTPEKCFISSETDNSYNSNIYERNIKLLNDNIGNETIPSGNETIPSSKVNMNNTIIPFILLSFFNNFLQTLGRLFISIMLSLSKISPSSSLV